MTSSWFGILIGAWLLLFQQGIKAIFVYPNCGLSDSSGIRIMNGVNSLLGQAPFMVYVMKDNKYQCGGSIVSDRYVLTAAHCLAHGLSVRLGEYDDRMNPDCLDMVCVPEHKNFAISDTVYHWQYNNVTQENDIALLRLNQSIEFQQHIQPICLFLSPQYVPTIYYYTVFGWGLTNPYDKEKAHVLQTANLRLYPKVNCRTTFRILDRNQICAGSEISDTCGGDSGSPLVFTDQDGRYIQLGIVSRGSRQCNTAGTYTYVPNYSDWIVSTMQSMDRRVWTDAPLRRTPWRTTRKPFIISI
ncbi:serine protease grass-like [Drosophila kikkawai]|uniref:Serine protease grass-like n=1 Tax=Drosophila kikkawai TaxID=30033 RepID=A0ABM4G9C9_DROKI